MQAGLARLAGQAVRQGRQAEQFQFLPAMIMPNNKFSIRYYQAFLMDELRRYTEISKLGQGHFGVVLNARHRDFTLRVIKISEDPSPATVLTQSRQGRHSWQGWQG